MIESFENKETKFPKTVRVEVLFRPHATIEDIDLETFKKRLSETDIYIQEKISWTDQEEEIFNKVSQGEMEPLNAINEIRVRNPQIWLERLKALYGKGVRVIFIDVPLDSGFINEYEKVKGGYQSLFKQDFKETIENFRNWLTEMARLFIKRDEIMLKNFFQRVNDAISKDPKLAEKLEIRILISIGSAHTYFYKLLKKEFPQAIRDMGGGTVSNHFDEALSRAIFEKPIDDDLIARAILTRFILDSGLGREIYELCQNKTSCVDLVVRKIVSQFSLDEIKDIYNQVLNSGLSLEEILNERLKQKQISLDEYFKQTFIW